MSTQSPDRENPETNISGDDFHSHHSELHALRLTLARLQSLVEHAEDPADLVRLAGAVARVSDSIVRALAAHHRLAELSEKSKLAAEWANLEEAREEQLRAEEQSKRDRAVWFHGEQSHWLRSVAEAAHEAAAGDPARAKEIASGLDVYIDADDYTYAPDTHLLARLRNGAAAHFTTPQGELVPYPANLSVRDPVVQLR
jgi:hypothetical protein